MVTNIVNKSLALLFAAPQKKCFEKLCRVGKVGLGGICVASLVCVGWKLYQFHRNLVLEKDIRAMLDEPCDELAEMQLEDEGEVRDVNPDPTMVVCLLNTNIELDMTPSKLKCHRRIKVGSKRKYERCLVAEIKNRFGTPHHTEANILAVRRYARNVMSAHGLRPTAQETVMSRVVEVVFVPSSLELQSRSLHQTWTASFRSWAYKSHAPGRS